MHKRLMDLMDFERYTVPSRYGTRYFYQHNSGLQNQSVVYWQEGSTVSGRYCSIRTLCRRMGRLR